MAVLLLELGTIPPPPGWRKQRPGVAHRCFGQTRKVQRGSLDGYRLSAPWKWLRCYRLSDQLHTTRGRNLCLGATDQQELMGVRTETEGMQGAGPGLLAAL